MDFLLGSDGYLFQLHTGHANQNRLIETALTSIPSILLVKVFYYFHYNLRRFFFFFFFFCFSFLGSLFQLHTGHAYQNCLIETVLISITGITG